MMSPWSMVYHLTSNLLRAKLTLALFKGYNLPVAITNNAGCHIANCPVDLGPNCPAALKGPFDSSGFPVGCKSDCLVDSDPTNSPSCCSGSYNLPSTVGTI